MKNDWSRSFYRQIAVNICYSALIACLVDAFLIMNMNFLLAYLDQTRYANLLILQIFKMGTITTILYVIVGIGIFALAFLMIEKKNMKYIGKIAVAIQNISEGDLNTQIEVVGATSSPPWHRTRTGWKRISGSSWIRNESRSGRRMS